MFEEFLRNLAIIVLGLGALYVATIIIGLIFYYLAYVIAKGIFKARSEFHFTDNHVTTVNIKKEETE
jgi:hypothetical protein